MSGEREWSPAPIQVVSDLGQLTAFGDAALSRILRILQREEATVAELCRRLEMPEEEIREHLLHLQDLVLVRQVADRDGEAIYRATAWMFSLRPAPRDQETISTMMADTMLRSLSREILASVETWPDQKMNFEWWRTRMPVNRAVEFNDRLGELIREYWTDDLEGIEEDPDEPLMSFLGVWYRYPE